MKQLITLIFLMIFTQINAQIWEKNYAADTLGNGYGLANAVAQTQDNGFIMAGEVDLPTGAIRHYVHLKKADENGNLLWEKSYGYGDIRDDRVSHVLEIPGGDIVIGGSSGFPTNGILIMRTNSVGDTIWRRKIPTPLGYTNTNFDPIANYRFLCFSRNNTELRLIKTDANGTLLFNKILSDYFIPKAAAELSNGDYILTGEKNGQLYLMRTDNLGDSIWTKQYQLGTSDIGSAIHTLPNGAFLIGGSISGIAGFNPTLAKFDINGDLVWHSIIGFLGSTAKVSDIELDSIGNIFVTGSFDPQNFFTFNGGFVARLDGNGQNIVVDTFNTVNRTDGSDLLFTDDGCLVVTGGSENGYYLRKQCDLTTTLSINSLNVLVDVYPNPMENILNFSIESVEIQNLNLKIYDINGRIIHQKNITNQYQYRNDNLNSGIYFYTLAIDNQLVKSGKFIKQ